eukprot:TRINITY_DN7704_c0_g1_i4.p1 TRINITY_DN7704_c0_g1~~TRINITY_DN7704_c0_g1_i4.p1  ORF type:complete len:193 (+),score=62.18 TRINITY_DN7704_c0_g1_i4:66-581(+)
MAEEEGSWDNTIEEWLISEGYCYAGGLAQLEDGAFYAAAPQADEKGWGFIFKEEYEESVLQDDGETEKKLPIQEAEGLKTLAETCKAPPPAKGGLWVGGKKYRVTKTDEKFESGDATFKLIQTAVPKGGMVVAVTQNQIVAGFFDEEKGQNNGNCTKAVVAFAEYLVGLGY